MRFVRVWWDDFRFDEAEWEMRGDGVGGGGGRSGGGG